MAGWTCDICVLKFPEDGNSGAETHSGDTYHELCFMIFNYVYMTYEMGRACGAYGGG